MAVEVVAKISKAGLSGGQATVDTDAAARPVAMLSPTAKPPVA